MEIKVLGTGCAGCMALHETVKQAVSELGLDAVVVKEQDMARIMSYDVLRLPALVVDESVVCSGKKLTLEQVKALLVK